MKDLLRILVVFLTASSGIADVVDRLAVIVGKTAFTQSEVEEEARLSQLESGKPLDLSAARRKEAAERMVDQQLLRDEIELTGFEPPAVESEKLLEPFCHDHFGSLPQCRDAFGRYGVTETAVKQRLLWEVTLVRFTDERFGSMVTATDGHATGANGDVASVDQQLESWLKQRRTGTRIVFKQEAFQ